MARSSLRQARRILEEAERHHREGVWHLAVRRSQETVELALKAALRAAGIEVPHVHDVGIFVREHAGKLSGPLPKHLDRVVSISRLHVALGMRRCSAVDPAGHAVRAPPQGCLAVHCE